MARTVKPKTVRIPRYCHHKGVGQAYVTLEGRQVYLGKYKLKPDGTPDCPEYHRLIAEWLANDGKAPPAPPTASAPLAVAEMLVKYWEHCQTYYRLPTGLPSGELAAVRSALRPVNKLFGDTPAESFGPKKLKQVRTAMQGMGWSRSNINRQVGRVKLAFRWAVGEELIPGSVDHALRGVTSLRFNPEQVRESEPVTAVNDAAIDAVLPHVSATVAAMIRLQRITGMRPGELVGMRMSDLEMKSDNGREEWTYRPAHHKTKHKGLKREIALGPKAREIVGPYLKPMKLDAFIFTAGDEGKAFDVAAYRRSISRGCDRAFPLPPDLEAAWAEVSTWWCKWTYDHDGKAPRLAEYPVELRDKRNKVEAHRAAFRWHPNRLRHSAATELRKKFGIEQARIILGHADTSMTETYAEQDFAAARQIMEQVG